MNIIRVNDQVHMVTGTNVNWALITEGDAVTVIDSGTLRPKPVPLAPMCGSARSFQVPSG